MKDPKIPKSKFNFNDTVEFKNKNTGYVLQGKVKGTLDNKIGVSLKGNSEMKSLADTCLDCLKNNNNRINVSWFDLNDIEFM